MKNLLFLLLLTSCVTPKKAVDVLSRPKNEPVAAEFCSLKYPVRDSIIKGDSVIRFDTLWETYTDTLISEPQVIIETKIVPKTVTKTVVVRDTIIRENTAKVRFMENLYNDCEKDNKGLILKLSDAVSLAINKTKESNKWKLRFFLLLFGVGLAYALKVKMTKKLW